MKLLRTLHGHSGEINGVVYGPNGDHIFSAGEDGEIRAWDVRKVGAGRLIAKKRSSFTSIACSPDGRFLAAGTYQAIHVWKSGSGESFKVIPADLETVESVAFSPDGKHLVSSGAINPIQIWDAQTGNLINSFGSACAVAYNFDGSMIVGGGISDVVVWNASTGELLRRLTGHTARVDSVAFTPNGKRVISASWDGTMKVWDVSSGKLIKTLQGHNGSVKSVAIAEGGRYFASGSEDKTVKVWPLTSDIRSMTSSGHCGSVLSVNYSPDGRHVLSAADDNTLRIWEASSGKLVRTYRDLPGFPGRSLFSPDGKRIHCSNGTILDVQSGGILVVGQENRKSPGIAINPSGENYILSDVIIRTSSNGGIVHALKDEKEFATCLSYSPDGLSILTGRNKIANSGANTLQLWDAQTGELLESFGSFAEEVRCLDFSPDGRSIVSGGGTSEWSNDTSIRHWNAQTGALLNVLQGHSDSVTSLAFFPDGAHIVSGSEDGSIRVWDLSTGKTIDILEGHWGAIHSLAISPDGFKIVSGSADRTIKIWTTYRETMGESFRGHDGSLSCVAFSPDGRRIASAGFWDDDFKLWDAQSKKLIWRFEGHTDVTRCFDFSPDGKYIVSGSADKTIKLWNVKTGRLIKTLRAHSGAIRNVRFDPESRRIVSAGSGLRRGEVILWELESGEILGSIDQSEEAIAFSSDGRYVALGSSLWEPESGKIVELFDGDAKCIAFSPNDQSVVIGSFNRLLIRDTNTGEILQELVGHSAEIRGVAFSPDGTRVISGSFDGTIRLWDVHSGDLLRTLWGHLEGVTSVSFRYDGRRVLSSSLGNRDGASENNLKLWDIYPYSIPAEKWYRPSLYLQKGWFNISEVDQQLDWSLSSLFEDRKFDMLNVAPYSIMQQLKNATSEGQTHEILADYYFNHYTWKPFISNWVNLNPKAKAARASDTLRVFLQLALDPPIGFVPGWFSESFVYVHREFPKTVFLIDLIDSVHIAQLLRETEEDLSSLEPFREALENRAVWPNELAGPILNAWK